MIQLPPPDAKPSLLSAAWFAAAIGMAATLGSVACALGAGEQVRWDGMIVGQMITSVILLMPLAVNLTANALSGGGVRPLPGGEPVWGRRDTLLLRAVRMSLFLLGFVLIYCVVAAVLEQSLPSPMLLGAGATALTVFGNYGILRIGPWSPSSRLGGA